MSRDSLKEQCEKIGLNTDKIKIHIERLKNSLEGLIDPTLKIIDTCRIDNGGVVDLNLLNVSSQDASQLTYVSFVPAAGASTRFFASFSELVTAITEGDKKAIAVAKQKLIEQNITSCHLHPDIRTFFETDDSYSKSSFLKLYKHVRKTTPIFSITK